MAFPCLFILLGSTAVPVQSSSYSIFIVCLCPIHCHFQLPISSFLWTFPVLSHDSSSHLTYMLKFLTIAKTFKVWSVCIIWYDISADSLTSSLKSLFPINPLTTQRHPSYNLHKFFDSNISAKMSL